MTTQLAPYCPGAASIVVDGEQPIAVFCDLHLQLEKPEELWRFAHSLQALVGHCSWLVILGDLFESYVGREDFLHPYWQPILQAWQQLREAGCSLVLVRGNRDVLLSPADGRALGFVVADSVLVRRAGGNLLLTHGDAFCLGDLPYQRLRRGMRRFGVRSCLRALPLRLRRYLARRLRSYSQLEVARKPLQSMHLTLPVVAQVAAESAAKEVWIGHLHQAARHDLGDGRLLRVLPAWTPGAAPHWIGEKLDETG